MVKSRGRPPIHGFVEHLWAEYWLFQASRIAKENWAPDDDCYWARGFVQVANVNQLAWKEPPLYHCDNCGERWSYFWNDGFCLCGGLIGEAWEDVHSQDHTSFAQRSERHSIQQFGSRCKVYFI